MTDARAGRTATLSRYAHTLAHLRSVQFYRRAWFRLARPRARLDPPPPLRPRPGEWVAPARGEPSLVGPARFRFLNEEHDLAAIGWDGAPPEKLWRYNQHYFGDLVARDARTRAHWHRDLLDRWVAANPPGQGTGWEPYPLSLRLVNVCKWALAGNALPSALLDSLAVQARWLEARIEWHLLANHLFVNGKALLFAGLLFEGAEADSWRRQGIAILGRELDEQILPDGAQFELSPMYHLLALEDVLDVVNAQRCFDVADCAPLAARFAAKVLAMRRWLAGMCHPDGEIAQFNDAAFGIAPAPAELHVYADRLGLAADCRFAAAELFAASGYFRLTAGAAVLIGDAAKVGPSYQAGHAHADTLSFELSLGQQRVFVNGGTSVYGTGPERARQRGTPAHNTVTVANRNSSDVWGGFRVGRRARPSRVSAGSEGAAAIASAAHDGYRALPGRPLHARSWRLEDGRLRIEDSVSNAALPAEARFHLHPDIAAHEEAAGRGALVLPDGRRLRWRADGAAVSLENGSWHPEFGITLPATCIVVQLDRGRAAFELDWA